MHIGNCVFCKLESVNVLFETERSLAFGDGFPIASGHTLVIPKRHVESIFELGDDEFADLFQLVRNVRGDLQQRTNCDGFNVGVNDG